MHAAGDVRGRQGARDVDGGAFADCGRVDRRELETRAGLEREDGMIEAQTGTRQSLTRNGAVDETGSGGDREAFTGVAVAGAQGSRREK